MEVRAILTAMTRRVKTVQVHSAKPRLNNPIHGYETMEASFAQEACFA